MILVKLHSSILVEARKKYSTLRMYTSDFEFEGDCVISRARRQENGKLRPELYDSLEDWAFNEEQFFTGEDENGKYTFEEGDAHKFFEEHPEGFGFKLISIANL